MSFDLRKPCGRVGIRHGTVVAAVLVLLSLILVEMATGVGASASTARAPTPMERGGIQQMIFDYFAKRPADPVITGIRISTHGPRSSAKANDYRIFGRVDLFDKRAGYAAAVVGYYVAPLSGWRVLALGSSEVGCRLPPKLFSGFKTAVLADLKLDCP